MANSKIKKIILIKGDKGEKGDTVRDDTIPINGLLYIDDEQAIPEGYESYTET